MDGTTPRSSPSTSRKRPRENETESQRIKREKAAERQRRKRERDRALAQSHAPLQVQQSQAQAQGQVQLEPQAQTQQQQQGYAHPSAPVVVNAAGMGMLYAPPDQGAIHLHHHPMPQLVHPQPMQMPANVNEYRQEQSQPPPQQPETVPSTQPQQPQLTKEEEARRDKVRAAARERQRKHRALVRQRKMREMGMEMEGEQANGAQPDAMRYPAPAEYVQQPDLQQAHQIAISAESQFPALAQGLGGQTFASTLLLSLSCAPLLKAHIMRSLNMTNEELASLEPVITEAWERWNAQRMQYHDPNRPATTQSTPSSSIATPSFTTLEAAQQQAVQAHAQVQAQAQAQAQAQQTQQQQPQPAAQQTVTQQQHPVVQSQSQSQVSGTNSTVSHPPPPTFAHANGPDISSLDFRNRFSHSIARPMPAFTTGYAEARTNGASSAASDSTDPHLTNGTGGKGS